MTESGELVPVEHAGEIADPVEYMAVALNRAKGWLAEAQSIEEVRNARAIAVGYESVIREKELAFDAQLSATEIVRRCERRIGELVRQGQQAGTVLRKGQKVTGADRQHVVDLLRPSEAMGVNPNGAATITAIYTLADAPTDCFEEAISAAREEGNLSRRNVLNKVKGESAGAQPLYVQQRQAADCGRVREALNRIVGMCEGLTSDRLHRAMAAADEVEWRAWRDLAAQSAGALKRACRQIDGAINE